MITSIYLKEHQYLIRKPQTLNFGGKYLYSYHPLGKNLIVRRKLNEKYIPDFFNISNSYCKIQLLSAIVGENGVGKSSILDVIRGAFVQHIYSMPHSLSTILVEIDGETKLLDSNFQNVYLEIEKDDDIDHIDIETIDKESYQSIYYSPHFDLKYNNDFSEVDEYDISLDQFIKLDLEDTDKKGTNENGWRFDLHDELLLKNSIRQIEFLNSSIFNDNIIFKEIFNLQKYNTGILHFRDVKIPDFHNTPSPLRPIIKLIFDKLENENSKWHIFRDENSHLGDKLNQALVNKYLLERFVVHAFLSIVIQQMEKSNTWLEEGRIENPYQMDRFKDSSAFETFTYFIKESYIEKGKFKRIIFNSEEILIFFKKLNTLFSKETNPDNIKKQSIRSNLDDIKDVLELHKKIMINLLHYYPTTDGLIKKSDYIDGFLAFRPTDRNMSSGENALLNFFSKLYSFIENNLVDNSKSLSDKENYIILLDEADLGFHPIWKKRYINAILKSLPHFFKALDIKPDLQIIITTHDPLTLSDLPINNVIFLNKDEAYCKIMSTDDQNKIQKTFGANITDLLAHSFFVEDGLIGDFSRSKIKEVIDWINDSQKLSEKSKSDQKFKLQFEYYKNVVNLIDEKIIKLKLAEMITDLVPDNDYYNLLIENEIEFLKNKKR
ncbi:AAA family ATPase [Flavobacterium sp. FlaQc-50]|jgi:predicted ATP-binding protein involved in virulence|uniref:AAA family ATPase n=1 Tax=unclassified Flavobacterium TaxID=196869 RepID=UPI003757A3B4